MTQRQHSVYELKGQLDFAARCKVPRCPHQPAYTMPGWLGGAKRNLTPPARPPTLRTGCANTTKSLRTGTECQTHWRKDGDEGDPDFPGDGEALKRRPGD